MSSGCSVACNDAQGLPLVTNGEVSGDVNGVFTSLIQAAATLSPDQSPPTIAIETDRRNFTVSLYDNLPVILTTQP